MTVDMCGSGPFRLYIARGALCGEEEAALSELFSLVLHSCQVAGE